MASQCNTLHLSLEMASERERIKGEFHRLGPNINLHYTSSRHPNNPLTLRLYENGKPGDEDCLFLTAVRWVNLMKSDTIVRHAEQCIRAGDSFYLKQHIGGGLYLKMRSPRTDIKLVILSLNPSTLEKKHEMTMTLVQWTRMKNIFDEMSCRYHSLIMPLKPCVDADSHKNANSYFACYECNPFE